ncbi:MAG: GTPase [Syntrophotaleaceae bacterium]
MSHPSDTSRRRVLVMGAGGRDFHNFNVLFRHRNDIEVVAFTATQIPFQENRLYPPSLAGRYYPDGIPVLGEQQLGQLIHRLHVEEVVFSYSDVSHQRIMEIASTAVALGADFRLVSSERTMLQASLPVISVGAVRTGCGKSPVTRFLCRLLLEEGRRPVVVRHPMAYGRLGIRGVERFTSLEDLDRYECTLEEREEFDPLIRLGVPLFAGVDYGEILPLAEQEGDLLIWDGGNNDVPFFRPDLELVLADPLRPGDERTYFPGLVNLVRADAVIISKVDQAEEKALETVEENIRSFNPEAGILYGKLEVHIADREVLRGKRVVVIEDGPTLTHGDMSYGAGIIAARENGVAEIVDPRPYAVGSLQKLYRNYPHLARVIPAMGYSDEQREDLRRTLERVECDLILSATPVDLAPLLKLSKPLVQVTYEFREVPPGSLQTRVRRFLSNQLNSGFSSLE